MNNDPATILVVDDEPEMARAVCELLQGADYQALSANSGEEALGIVKREQPDLLISDLRMTEMTELLTPREVYKVSFPLYPTSNLFKAGHRIRVDISSSNFPRFDVNPNTGAPLGEPGSIVVAENSVHHDAEHPSHVVLPVVA
jgi:putative CocE/NonD family hydrolase